KPRGLGAGPWRVEGRLAPIADQELGTQTKEAGVRVNLEGGGAVALVVKQLGGVVALTAERFSGDEPTGKPRRAKLYASKAVPAKADVSFAISVEKDRIVLEANDAALSEIPLGGPGEGASGVALYVDEGAVRFRDLVQRKPAKN